MSRRESFLPFALPDTDETEVDAVSEVIRSGWLTTGSRVRAFESAFASLVDAKHAIAVSSCTAAMHFALEAIGIKAGDEVATTPYTFAATAEVIRYLGAHPVLVDIDPATFNMDPEKLRMVMTTRRIAAVMPVHIAGHPCEIDSLTAVAGNVPIVEDAAHALPSGISGRPIGTLSRATCFSFYATKTLATGEGGMITTNDDALAERCRIMSLHGISRDAWKRYTADGTWRYDIIAPGYKYNLTDIAAALGLAQLAKLERMWRRRVAIARRYDEAFASYAELQLPPRSTTSKHAWHLYMLRIDSERIAGGRDAFYEAMRSRNIGVSVHFIPLHIHPYYRDTYGFKPEDFPLALGEFLREISLPIYSRMSDSDVEDVITAVLASVDELRK
jgi:dTDP-4-amino-4,6-dideoxygalactose transaminase